MNEMGDATILIVDDEPANITLLQRIFAQAGYERCVGLSDPRRFWEVFAETVPDIVLVDLHMPHVSGFQILSGLATGGGEDEFLPALVLTADISSDTKHRALSLGAKDFLTKPFDTTEVLQRVANLLHTRSLTHRLREQNAVLDQRVRERTQELADANIETVERLALAAEHRDDDTGEHIHAVGQLSGALASEMGLTPGMVELIRVAAPLHDVGKIGLPDSILGKAGRLTDDEVRLMRTHAAMGANILAGARTPVMEVARTVALTHHERWDGSGYPRGLSGGSIPLAGRIVAVADVFDALTRARVYKRAWTPQEALDAIRRDAGIHFDPVVVAAFFALIERGEVSVLGRRVRPPRAFSVAY